MLDEIARSVRGPLHRRGSAGCAALTPDVPLPGALAVLVAADAYDVACAVRLASGAGVRVAALHPGDPDADLAGALAVHLRPLGECDVHPAGWVRVGAGVTGAELTQAAAPLGLRPPVAVAADVPVVREATSGGPVSDAVRAVDVVTATGRLVRATSSDSAELFYRLREGGGSFGVVTALELDLVRR